MKKIRNKFIVFLFNKLMRLGIISKNERDNNNFDLLTYLLEKKKKTERELNDLESFKIKLDIFHKVLDETESKNYDKKTFEAVYKDLKKEAPKD